MIAAVILLGAALGGVLVLLGLLGWKVNELDQRLRAVESQP